MDFVQGLNNSYNQLTNTEIQTTKNDSILANILTKPSPKKLYGNNHIWCHTSGVTGRKYYHMFYAFLLYSCPYVTMLIILIIERKKKKI